MDLTWPWLTIAALGIFHGLNPAMGWLFAVALGLHRQSRRAVLLALPPIALGHAFSIWLAALSVIAIGAGVSAKAAGALLLAWAAYHWLSGHRHRVRIGMTTGLTGLTVWSFLMASAHGAGLMLAPALMPLCARGPLISPQTLSISLAAAGLHTAALLAMTGLIALPVYEWLGLALLRRGWINFDLLWTGALAATGLALTLLP
ncbi:MAG: hypothetical protein J2P47_09240 [Acetobacteraceae bacterium]|nr:hypothetical protein [Acetobacteraceae bacterium]